MRTMPLALLLALCTTLPWFSAAAHAQGTPSAYPSRPIRFIVSPSPGGLGDTFSRAVAAHLALSMGQPVVVENRPGANEAIGLELAARAAPDGYTIVLGSLSGIVLTTAARKTLPYDPLRDFAAISMLFSTPFYLVVHPSVPARSVRELIDLAKSQPGKLSYASIGVGSALHLAMEMFKTRTGVDMLHVPYSKGSGPAMADLLAGQVQVMFQGPVSTLPHVHSGKLRALATSGLQRAPATPELPTLAEGGVPGFDISAWFGLFAPAGVPRPIIDRLNREVGVMLRSPATREKFAASNIDLVASTPEEMSERVRLDLPVFTAAMRNAGIDPQ
jgi:tripartite-type tricarboxylate transporter receptor subunit TctC